MDQILLIQSKAIALSNGSTIGNLNNKYVSLISLQ